MCVLCCFLLFSFCCFVVAVVFVYIFNSISHIFVQVSEAFAKFNLHDEICLTALSLPSFLLPLLF